MIRLSRLTDYAIVIVAELSSAPGTMLAAATLSAKTGIPEPTVAKVLKILARNNIITSARGVNGGYVIDRPATAVSIAELVEAVNGPINLTACADDAEPDCMVADMCLMRGRWGTVNAAIHAAFSAVMLSDMIAPATQTCAVCTHKVGASS
jgi:FeS assembly SUF system regulator